MRGNEDRQPRPLAPELPGGAARKEGREALDAEHHDRHQQQRGQREQDDIHPQQITLPGKCSPVQEGALDSRREPSEFKEKTLRFNSGSGPLAVGKSPILPSAPNSPRSPS